MPSVMIDFANTPLKVSVLWVYRLFLESCPEKELLAKQFASNWNMRYVLVINPEKGGRQFSQVQQIRVLDMSGYKL